MRNVRKILRVFTWILGIFCGLSLIAALLLFLILLRPDWFLHEASLRWTAEHVLAPMDIALDFDEFSAEFAKEDLFHQSLGIKSRNIRLRMKNLELNIPYLVFQSAFDLHPLRLGLTSLGPVEVLGGKLNMQLAPPDPLAEPFKLEQKWIDSLDRLKVEPLHVVFDEIIVSPHQQEPITSRLDARLSKTLDTRVWTLGMLVEQLHMNNNQLKLDLQRAEARLDFKLGEQGLLIKSLGPIDAQGQRFELTMAAPDPNPNKSPEKSGDNSWVKQLKGIELQPISITWKNVQFNRPNAVPLQADINLKLTKPEAQLLDLSLLVDKLKGVPAKSLVLDVAMAINPSTGLFPFKARIKGKADLAKMGRAQLNGRVQIENEYQADYQLEAAYNYGISRFTAISKGHLNQDHFAINLSGQVTRPHEKLEKIDLPSCQFSGLVGEKRSPFLDAALDCKIALTRVPAPAEQPFGEMLPRQVLFTVKGPISIPVWNDKPHFSAPLSIDLLPLKSELYRLSSHTDLKLSGQLFAKQESFNGTVDIDTQLELDRFSSVVTRLSGTDFSIPAPFNTLDGKIQCTVRGRLRIESGLVHLPVACSTELDSSTQTVWIKVDGLVQTRKQMKPLVKLNVNLEKVTFELPKLSIDEPVPQLLPDKRIAQLGENTLEAGAEPLPVELDVKISTPRGRPLALASHLAKKPIPISIDMALKGDKPIKTGSLAIEDYDVSFVKKKAHIDHIRMIFDPEIASPALDGLVVFKDPEFRIDFKLSGTIDRPFYSMESQPPRSSSELLSMILFGGSSDSLDEDSQRSVEETRAAMVDGAVGLLSMYYLASTNIESVGYNPHTGIFRAKVRLGKTLSLMVGSDLEGAKQSVGMRKRLTENWSFETTAQTNEESKTNHGTAMFRWGRRY